MTALYLVQLLVEDEIRVAFDNVGLAAEHDQVNKRFLHLQSNHADYLVAVLLVD